MYYIEIALARLLFWLLSSCRVTGQDNVPADGPLLIVANHLSVADPPALGVFVRKRAAFMAKEELFTNKILSYFVSSFGAFPVYRGRINRDALRQAGEVLKQGKALIMFPEGKRSKSRCMQPGLPGSTLIAYRNKVPILPVGIAGTEVIRGFGWIWGRPKININVGRVFFLPETGQNISRDHLATYTEIIMKRIAELVPEDYQGSYAERNNK